MFSRNDQVAVQANTSLTVVLPANFTLAHYRLTLETLEMLELQPFKGSALRGGFGHTFKRLVCTRPRDCHQSCHRGNSCSYGYIFETAPPPDSQVLRTFSEVPRPFIITPPTDRRTRIGPGERLSFGLTLIGQGLNYLPYFIAVFEELGQVGLGRSQGRYRLQLVEAVQPYTGASYPLYREHVEAAPDGETIISRATITARVASLPSERLTLELLTAARLKHQSQWVRQGPPFPVLIKTLLGRMSSLSYFHCGQPFEADFRGLIERAGAVRLVEGDARWEDWSRFSGRQKQRIDMGGLVGRVTYEGDLSPYLPLLALGELIHVGKGTVFGNGQYHIVK